MKRLIFIFIFLSLHAQEVNWIFRYNPENGLDGANDVVVGDNGYIYVAGYAYSNDSYYDFTVICLTETGDTNWIYKYNGPDNGNDVANSIVYGEDGNIYVAGYTGSGYSDVLVISLTPNGNERWIYTFDGPAGQSDFAKKIIYGKDGNLYIAGYTTGVERDMLVISLTNTGSERWVYIYNGLGNMDDEVNDIIFGADTNIYIAGTARYYRSGYDFFVMSFDTSGVLRWRYRFDSTQTHPINDIAYSITCGPDGNIYATGRIRGLTYSIDLGIISLTPTGEQRWIYRYNGPVNGLDVGYSIVSDSNGNLYVTGMSYHSIPGFYDIVTLSVDTSGNERWVYVYGGSGNDRDEGNKVIYADGNVYITGEAKEYASSFDIIVMSFDTSGNLKWNYRYNGPGNGVDKGNSIFYKDSILYVAGISTDLNSDFTVISLNPYVKINEFSNYKYKDLFFIPTFFKNQIFISFNNIQTKPLEVYIYNISGSLLLKKILPAGLSCYAFEFKEIRRGIYFISLCRGDKKLGYVKIIK